eukprot:gene30517-37749_t
MGRSKAKSRTASDMVMGRLTDFSDGSVFVGSFLNGLKHGEGVLTVDDTKIEGIWSFGLPSGAWMEITFSNGNVYIGEVSPDSLKRNGSGELTDVDDGLIYNGEWKDGKKHGKGEFYFDNGDHIEGLWMNDLAHGDCVAKYLNGNIYIGAFQNGVRSGQGVMTYSDGSVYEGLSGFKADERSGTGTMTWNHDNGQWLNDIRHGYTGTMTFKSGDVYQGRWVRGSFQSSNLHGFGHVKDSLGHEFSGTFAQGSRKFITTITKYCTAFLMATSTREIANIIVTRFE